MRARRAATLAAAVVLVGCGTQNTNQPALPAPKLISGALSVATGCRAGVSAAGQPGEPSLAVDPTNDQRLIAAWLDNRSPDTIGIVVAISENGGKQWRRSALAPLVSCSGGAYVPASDPWISIGPDGVVYLSTLARRPSSAAGTPYDIVVSVSRDHGATWSGPVVLESATAPPTEPDKESILADRRHAGTAYAVWADYGVTPGVEPSMDRVMFARTTDGGQSWTAPAPLYSGNDESQENQLLMTAGGVLLDIFVEASSLPGSASPPPLPVKLRVMRSKDQGQTWSSPIDAASFSYTTAVDPAKATKLRASGQNIVAAIDGNAVYVSWFEDHRDFSTILVARSDDAGLKWRASHIAVRQKAPGFSPNLADAWDGLLWILSC